MMSVCLSPLVCVVLVIFSPICGKLKTFAPQPCQLIHHNTHNVSLSPIRVKVK